MGARTFAGYLHILSRHKWMILVIVGVALAASLFFSSRQSKAYEASAQVLLGQSTFLGYSNGSGLTSADVRARYDATQAQVAHTTPVAAAAGKEAGIPIAAHQLLTTSSVTANPDTDVLTFMVTSSDPTRARRLATAYANAFASYRSHVDLQGIKVALSRATATLRTISTQVASQQRVNGKISPALRSQYEQQLSNVQGLRTLEAVQQSNVEVIQTAASASQVRPTTIRNAAIGLLLGLALGVALMLLRESLDSRIRVGTHIPDRLGVPLLGRIPRPTTRLSGGDGALQTASDSTSGRLERYRQLRVGLDFANLKIGAQTILVTSAIAKEGKSTTVANLAVLLAEAGRDVVLVDCDFRNPTIIKYFNVPESGVTDVLSERVSISDAVHPCILPRAEGAEDHTFINPGRLRIMPAGSVAADPAFLETQNVGALLRHLGAESDIVLVDSAPLLAVSESSSLAASVDAILLVAMAGRLGRTELDELERTLRLTPTPVLGVVLTGDDDNAQSYGYAPYYNEAIPTSLNGSTTPHNRDIAARPTYVRETKDRL